MRDKLNQLEKLLGELLSEHELLRGLLAQKRDAICQAKVADIETLTRLEHEKVRVIAALEEKRQLAVGAITQQWRPEATQPPTLAEIAELADAAQAERLIDLRDRLKREMELAARDAARLKRTVEGVLTHVKGIMAAWGQALATTGTYSRKGRVYGNNVQSCSISVTG